MPRRRGLLTTRTITLDTPPSRCPSISCSTKSARTQLAPRTLNAPSLAPVNSPFGRKIRPGGPARFFSDHKRRATCE